MAKEINFRGKNVVVTGSTRGIGRAIAEAFAAAGGTVLINSRTHSDVERVVSELRAVGFSAEGYAADVSNPEEIKRLMAFAKRELGGIHVLVNNAGRSHQVSLEEVSVGDWDLVMNTSLRGPFLCSQSAVEELRRTKGVIVMISSQIAVTGSLYGGFAYAAAKGGLYALTRALARALGKDGIRVNAILPGMIRSDLTKTTLKNPEIYDNVLRRSALRRPGLPEEVAGAAIFLASDYASFITGQGLHIDTGPLA